MSISSRFSVGIHILTMLDFEEGRTVTSEMIAGSVNTNPAVIRKIMGMLKKAGLIIAQPGIPGAMPAKPLSEITLYDVYKAVNVVGDNELFSMHNNPNPHCPVGKNIQNTIEPIFADAQSAMEGVLKHVTLQNIVSDIKDKV